MFGGIVMEHNPLMSFNDGLEITYSDLKHGEDGDYVVLYFEKPNGKESGFNSAKFIYPGNTFSEVNGFEDSELKELMKHATKTAPLALEFSKEDSNATI